MSKTQTRYEIQQDTANMRRVIRVAPDGQRRAWDHPPCRTVREARAVIRNARQNDRDMLALRREGIS